MTDIVAGEVRATLTDLAQDDRTPVELKTNRRHALWVALDEAVDFVSGGSFTLVGVAHQVTAETTPAYLTITNTHATAALYYGTSTVTGASDGLAIAAGQSRVLKLRNPSLAYVIAAASSGSFAVER